MSDCLVNPKQTCYGKYTCGIVNKEFEAVIMLCGRGWMRENFIFFIYIQHFKCFVFTENFDFDIRTVPEKT